MGRSSGRGGRGGGRGGERRLALGLDRFRVNANDIQNPPPRTSVIRAVGRLRSYYYYYYYFYYYSTITTMLGIETASTVHWPALQHLSASVYSYELDIERLDGLPWYDDMF